MIRLFGVIFLCILFEAPFLVADHLVGNGFLERFFGGHSITLMGTLLGLNFVIVVFMIQSMAKIEFKIKKPVFSITKREIKHNTYFMLTVFLLHLLILIVSPKVMEDSGSISRLLAWLCKCVNLLLFGLSLYCIREVVCAAFTIGELGVLGGEKCNE